MTDLASQASGQGVRGSITTVVFDADETLIDLPPAVRGGLIAVLDEMRRLTPAAAELTLADLEADWDPVFAAMRAAPVTEIRRAALARSLARVGLEPELDRIATLFFARRFALTRPYDEVGPVLAALRERFVVGFATNGNSRAGLCGLPGEFAFEVYAHADGLPKKPAAEFFQAVVRAAGRFGGGGRLGRSCAPESIVHVGDSLAHDVVGAQAAGLRAVWLNRAGARRPPDAHPDAEIRSLAELPAALAMIN
jgi:putative hydrolase of the HAD superfamily